MANLVTITVDAQEVQVEEGKNLIDALNAVGIHIPHFCYHPALGFDGNCRMCLVEVEGPRGWAPMVACNTPVRDGLNVKVNDESSWTLRRNVLEFELINHPLDCPICDQAGECKLQDYYMEAGLYESRMEKNPVLKGKAMDFGCNVVHDQERCVLCARCVRFLRQYPKTAELGIINRGDRARVTPFPGKPLNNRYAMNIVDLCPVGALTSKDFRFKQRVWFMDTTKSVCHACARNCAIEVDHNQEKYKDERVYRFRPRQNDLVNAYFMCDQGRLSYHAENRNRLQNGRVDGFPVDARKAQDELARALKTAGSKALILVSPSWTLEQLAMARKLAAATGATLSAWSDGYVQQGDGDDWLIRDDKAANRASVELLGIDQNAASFERAFDSAELVLSLGHNLFGGLDAAGAASLRKRLEGKTLAVVSAHDTDLARMARIAVPCTSYTEYAGSLINCDGILQCIGRAVRKRYDAQSPDAVLAALAGLQQASLQQVRAELADEFAVLRQADWDAAAATGVALEAKEEVQA